MILANITDSQGGCVTVKVSGHVIDAWSLKINKNVKTIEIDHIGAYLCVRKHPKSLNLQVLCPFIVYKCNKRRLKTHVFVTVQWLHYHLFLSCNVSLVSVKLCHLLPRKYFYILKKRFILDSSAEILTTIEDVSKTFK